MTASPHPRATTPSGAARRRALAVGIIVLAALAAYHNSLRGGFVFDDHATVLDNASIRQLWPPTAWFSPPNEAGVAGRPVANFTFALNYAVSGFGVWSYHAGNLALHAAAALLLFGLVRRTLLRPALGARFGADSMPLALAAAVIWLVHPLATATVDYLSQRTELLAALCQLLVLYSFARATECHLLSDIVPKSLTSAAGQCHLLGDIRPIGQRRCWLGVSVVACALGMASKETMVTAPVLVLLYDRTFVAGSFREAWRTRRWFYASLGATWLLLAGLMASSRLPDRGIGFGLGVTWLDYALTECRAQLHYLRLALWPSPLVFDYGWDYVRDPQAAAVFVAGLIALIGAAAFAVWQGRIWGFAGAWFFLLLAPSSSVVPVIQQPVAENRVYLALAGVVALAVVSVYAAFGRRVWTVAAGIAVLGCTLTLQRNLDYADEISLWTDTVVKRPQNARAHSNLSAALLLAGQVDESLRHALAAIQLRPSYPDAHTNAGGALVQLGRAEEAVPHFEAALSRLPDSAAAHYNLANALLRAGQTDSALAHFETTLRLNPAQAQAHNDLGVALLQLGRTTEAIAHGAESIRLAPQSADAHYNFGNALAQGGQLPESIGQLRTAVRLKPDFAKAHNNLGAVLLRAGRAAEAIVMFESALRINPGYAEARRNLETARRAPPPKEKPPAR